MDTPGIIGCEQYLQGVLTAAQDRRQCRPAAFEKPCFRTGILFQGGRRTGPCDGLETALTTREHSVFQQDGDHPRVELVMAGDNPEHAGFRKHLSRCGRRTELPQRRRSISGGPAFEGVQNPRMACKRRQADVERGLQPVGEIGRLRG